MFTQMMHDDFGDLFKGMPPLDQLMHQHGVRSVEIDILPDPEGGRSDNTGSSSLSSGMLNIKFAQPLLPN